MPGELDPILEPFQLLIARSHTAVELLGLAEDGKLVVVVLFGEVDVHLVSTRVKPLDVEPGRAGAEVLLIALVIRLDSLVEGCIVVFISKLGLKSFYLLSQTTRHPSINHRI